jgi:hypothetical protein
MIFWNNTPISQNPRHDLGSYVIRIKVRISTSFDNWRNLRGNSICCLKRNLNPAILQEVVTFAMHCGV